MSQTKPLDNTAVNNDHVFGQYHSQWWDPSGPLKPLHSINPTRGQFVLNCWENTKLDRMTLDVGCGAGIFSEFMAEQNFKVTAIDANEKLIKIAKIHAKLSKLDIKYIYGTLNKENDAHLPHQIPLITCLEVIEHCPKPFELLHLCHQHLQPGGLLVISTLNRNIKSYIKSIILAEYVLKLIPQGTHQYADFIKPSEIMTWARSLAMTLIDIKGIDYNPLTNTSQLSEKLDNNYILCLKK